jgi:hypothetical protein
MQLLQLLLGNGMSPKSQAWNVSVLNMTNCANLSKRAVLQEIPAEALQIPSLEQHFKCPDWAWDHQKGQSGPWFFPSWPVSVRLPDVSEIPKHGNMSHMTYVSYQRKYVRVTIGSGIYGTDIGNVLWYRRYGSYLVAQESPRDHWGDGQRFALPSSRSPRVYAAPCALVRLGQSSLGRGGLSYVEAWVQPKN